MRVVSRERLTSLIEREIPDHKLVVLAAATGYGKTTLMAQWARMSRHQVVWLSLDEDDNDVVRLLHSLTVAWERLRPAIATSSLAQLAGSYAPTGTSCCPPSSTRSTMVTVTRSSSSTTRSCSTMSR